MSKLNKLHMEMRLTITMEKYAPRMGLCLLARFFFSNDEITKTTIKLGNIKIVRCEI